MGGIVKGPKPAAKPIPVPTVQPPDPRRGGLPQPATLASAQNDLTKATSGIAEPEKRLGDYAGSPAILTG